MSIEWHEPVKIQSETSKLFVSITKSKGDKPIYSVHILRELNNGESSKHIPATYNPKTRAVSLPTEEIDILLKDAKAWIEDDLRKL